MAYATNNPPKCMLPGLGSGPALWVYQSTDVHTDVDAPGYFSNGGRLGMKAGDVVIVQDTDTGTHNTTIHSVQSVTAGAATISAAVLA